MELINIKKHGIPAVLEGAYIAIGNFDGVHKGHQQILLNMRNMAKKAGRSAGVLTFDPNPIEFFLKDVKNYRLSSFSQKLGLLDSLGLDFVAYAEFDERFSQIKAEDFVANILAGKLKPAHITTGDDFKFGHSAKGNSTMLAELAQKHGFGYTAVPAINTTEGIRYSSSLARKYIEQGKPENAAKILGRNFAIEGVVIEGAKKGRELGFPTANIDIAGYVMPKFGVYEVATNIDGRHFNAVANVGVKPTFGNSEPLLEAHILDFNENLYNKTISVELKSFIREEMKFASVELLKKQIKQDVGTIGK